ncbi:angiopoietin-related protein 3-like [Mya arenaria]|uniref:angiopoietin-related protein 3-like n=1 Tax=Mya arenaria TaxID=6604 RepID=UPI0022DFD043|nr:angiopoietin-related protein 3-like [Mya arenaria]
MRLFVVLTQIYSTFFSSLTCLRCRGVIQPRYCSTVVDCNEGEVCSVERVITDLGDIEYNLGCSTTANKEACSELVHYEFNAVITQVFQYRFNGSVDFYRNFASYEHRFGSVHGEFWMGLSLLHEMTNRTVNELRWDMTGMDDANAFDQYANFSILAGPTYRLQDLINDRRRKSLYGNAIIDLTKVRANGILNALTRNTKVMSEYEYSR